MTYAFSYSNSTSARECYWPKLKYPDGDKVTLGKDLKVKSSSTTLKVGSKIKGIRLVSGDHEVDCKTEAGNMLLKACFLKKA